MREDGSKKILFTSVTRGTPLGPIPSRMQNVPWRTLLLVPTLARIVIAKPVDYSIPDWHELADHHGFAKGNPDIIDDEIAALEIRQIQVLGLLDGLCMLTQAIVEHLPWGNVQTEATLPGAGGDCLADVDGNGEFVVAVSLRNRLVRLELANVVDGVNTSPAERVRRGKRKDRSLQAVVTKIDMLL